MQEDDNSYDDSYFEQYLNPSKTIIPAVATISAEPSLNVNALGSKEYGPSLPTATASSTPRRDMESVGGVPYPAGYQKPTQSLTSILSSQHSKTKIIQKPKDKQRTIYTVNTESTTDNLKFRKRTALRQGGGQTWEDSSLLDWDENDFRIFCGDLGNEVTDEMLYKAFSKYSSLQKARVIRDKKTLKTKGYGFVSMKDPNDFLNAMKQMNGAYVGSRPITLKQSSWKDRNVDVKTLGLNKKIKK